MGTRNALSYFGLTYIEFLAISDPDGTARRDGQVPAFAGCRAVAAGSERSCFGWRCAATTSRPLADQLRRKGLAVSPIVDGQRNDPQGNIIRWRIFTIDGDTDGLDLSICAAVGEDDTTRAGAAARSGTGRAAPAGRHCAEQAVFEVVNPQAVRDRWQALLGFPPQGSRDWTWAASGLLSAKDPLTS
ncbi:VOC family protein [Klebsiella variicola subsp. variicola]|nr:VOC family protein [Klebsiella variicola subsp. variicola]